MTHYRLRITRDTDSYNPRTDCDNANTMASFRHSQYRMDDGESFDDFGDFVGRNIRELTADEVRTICLWAVNHDRSDYRDWMEAYRGNDSCKGSRSDYVEYLIDQCARYGHDDCIDVLLPFVGVQFRLVYINGYDGSASCGDANDGTGGSRPDGVIYCDAETVEKEWAGDNDKAQNYLKASVATYSAWASGDVWGFELEKSDDSDVTDPDDLCDCCGWSDGDSCWGFMGYDSDDDLADAIADHIGVQLIELAKDACNVRETWHTLTV